MPKNLIVISKQSEDEDVVIENWTTLTSMCKCHVDFSYHYLKTMKFPFKYKEWNFEKKNTNTCSN